ncbi:unnamed protein product, partial [Effrenium voratum]
DWHGVFKDLEAFSEALFNVGGERPESDFNAGVPPEVLMQLRRLPLFIHGLSLGGMIGTFVGLRLQQHQHLRKIFRGAVLGAPALQVPLPPQAVVSFLRTCVVPCWGQYQMPACVSSSSKVDYTHSYVLSDAKQRTMAEMEMRDDAVRFPGLGLGWPHNMRWATAGAYSALFGTVEEELAKVEYPFLLLHDPEDQICLVGGSELFMKLSPSADKELVHLKLGGYHVLPFVDMEQYVTQMCSWILKHL